MQSLVTGALMSAVSAIGNGTGPVRVPETRIVVAPFCGVSSRNAEQSRTLVDEIGRYCNAIYYAPWLFLERRPSHVVAPNEYGRSELSLRSPILAGAVESAEVCLRGGKSGSIFSGRSSRSGRRLDGDGPRAKRFVR